MSQSRPKTKATDQGAGVKQPGARSPAISRAERKQRKQREKSLRIFRGPSNSAIGSGRKGGGYIDPLEPKEKNLVIRKEPSES